MCTSLSFLSSTQTSLCSRMPLSSLHLCLLCALHPQMTTEVYCTQTNKACPASQMRPATRATPIEYHIEQRCKHNGRASTKGDTLVAGVTRVYPRVRPSVQWVLRRVASRTVEARPLCLQRACVLCSSANTKVCRPRSQCALRLLQRRHNTASEQHGIPTHRSVQIRLRRRLRSCLSQSPREPAAHRSNRIISFTYRTFLIVLGPRLVAVICWLAARYHHGSRRAGGGRVGGVSIQ